LDCSDCQRATFIPSQKLDELVDHERAAPNSKFVDFVCPHCGSGRRQPIESISTRETANEVQQVPIFNAFLKCSVKNCPAHVTVRTIAISRDQNAKPQKPLAQWKLDGIKCYEGHAVKTPLEMTDHTVT